MKVISQNDFQNEVVDYKGIVLVDFYADWCMPCKMVAPILEQLDTEYEGKVKFLKINVDNDPEISSSFGIMGIPTVILFKDGKAVKAQSGAGPADFYKELINSVM